MREQISLLWPAGHQPPARPSPDTNASYDDLGLAELVHALDHDGRQASYVRTILVTLVSDPAVIRYRQEILADLSRDLTLQHSLSELLPTLRELGEIRQLSVRSEGNELLQVVRRLRELELYVDVVQRLLSALDAASSVSSPGLRLAHEFLAGLTSADEFRRLTSELPRLRAAMQKMSSITIGVNLDEQARPVAATLLSVHDRPFSGKPSFLARILGKADDDVAGQGIAPLHSVAAHSPSPFLQPLFRDLREVLRLICQPVAQALSRYVHVSASPLSNLASEIAFYLAALRLQQRLQQAGLPLCQPEILPREERASHVVGLYNINLALQLIEQPPREDQPTRPIPSDLHMGQSGRSFILTGPNMGGKTTYVQAVGLAHVLAQAGLFVPGCSAAMSPVDGIYTHFPALEELSEGSGRLGHEAQRLAAIFSEATPNSLVLLNESLSSTSPGESLYLAQDIARALRLLGARSIYATHLHELARTLDDINQTRPEEPPTTSLVAGIVPPHQRSSDSDLGRTYRIEPGPPQGTSYAREIAQRHGISLPQLVQRLQERGIVSEQPRLPEPPALR